MDTQPNRVGYQGHYRGNTLKIFNAALIMGCMGFASALPTTVYAQDADVIDSYPKEVLKQRAAKRKAEREAAAAVHAGHRTARSQSTVFNAARSLLVLQSGTLQTNRALKQYLKKHRV